jgi:hypothetical protein
VEAYQVSRPTYETSEHLDGERRAIEHVEAIWGVQCNKTPKYYKIDYTVVSPNNNVVGWAEVRGKNFVRGKYRTFYTSLEKAMTLVRFEALTAKPAVVIVAWLDGIYCYRFTVNDTRTRQIKWDGRTVNSRGDDQDIEPVIHIPVDAFTLISETPCPFA